MMTTSATPAALWGDYPMGPSIRSWLAIPQAAYQGASAAAPSSSRELAFSDFLRLYGEDHPPADSLALVDLMDELLAMNLPLVVLKLADMYPALWRRDELRGLIAEGSAAMLVGELGRSELCFRQAQELAPSEPSPYVNMVQIMHHDERYQEAWQWCEAGLAVDANHFRLWELVASHFQRTHSDYLPAFIAYARSSHAWAGMALAAELDPLANQQTKASYLQPFYHRGERSHEFLIEYTGALGTAGSYNEIPPLVWQAEKMASQLLPWQLSLHAAQSQLALEDRQSFLEIAAKILKNPNLPPAVAAELTSLMKEAREELLAASVVATPTSPSPEGPTSPSA